MCANLAEGGFKPSNIYMSEAFFSIFKQLVHERRRSEVINYYLRRTIKIFKESFNLQPYRKLVNSIMIQPDVKEDIELLKKFNLINATNELVKYSVFQHLIEDSLKADPEFILSNLNNLNVDTAVVNQDNNTITLIANDQSITLNIGRIANLKQKSVT